MLPAIKLKKEDRRRLEEAQASMVRLRRTFHQGDNRFGEYGRNCREAFERHARVYVELTGNAKPSIYD